MWKNDFKEKLIFFSFVKNALGLFCLSTGKCSQLIYFLKVPLIGHMSLHEQNANISERMRTMVYLYHYSSIYNYHFILYFIIFIMITVLFNPHYQFNPSEHHFIN